MYVTTVHYMAPSPEQICFLSRCIIHHQIVCRKGNERVWLLWLKPQSFLVPLSGPTESAPYYVFETNYLLHEEVLLFRCLGDTRVTIKASTYSKQRGTETCDSPITTQKGFTTEQPWESCGREQGTSFVVFLLM